MGRIKKKSIKENKIKVPTDNNIVIDYPVFCFKHLQTAPNKDYKFYADFIERLKKLCNLSWNQISVAQKHGFGTEKIPVNQIKPEMPKFVTPDVTDLIVFRANGDNRPFLGLRKDNIFRRKIW
ncbi:hypothetical protein [Flavobacterium pectinovorum]|uniref:hypothetical protein n=1 Tax=Flavobacterium pectinovorum TaxID=29533 RepID=UPI001FADAB40|nr:hypothetical protein [Flavobacterium pectinovorum]